MKKEQELKAIVEDLLWMAARYAHGRQTFAPRIVRDAVLTIQRLYPGYEPKIDHTIKRREHGDRGMDEDYLDDIFNPNPPPF